MIGMLSLLFIGYILCCYLLDNSIFGIFIIITLISFLTLMPFYRYFRSFNDLTIKDYIWYYSGFVLGVVYWAFYRDQFGYAISWALLYIIALAITLILGINKSIKK